MMKKRVLVTGAAGFIGSHVADHCLRHGMEVVAVDNLSGGFRDNVPAQAEFIRGDVRETRFVADLWTKGRFDYVYHLAAYAAEGLSHFIRHFNYENNLCGSINLLNQSVLHNVERFIFTSSIAVYGRGQIPMTEELVPAPEDPYGIAKYAFELDLKCAHEMFGLEYVIFRPHNVYGERQNIADKYRNVVGIFMNQVMKGEEMSVFGDGMQRRAFSHIDDVASVIARSPLVDAARGQTFNVGADVPYTILELGREIAGAFGQAARMRHLPARNEVVDAFADHSKLRSVFGEIKGVELADGIRRMAGWARAVGPRSPVEFNDIELTKNLPPSWQPLAK